MDETVGHDRADSCRSRREPLHAVRQELGARAAICGARLPAQGARSATRRHWLADRRRSALDSVYTTVDLELVTGRIALSLAAWVLLGERLDSARADEIAHNQREVVRWVGERLGQLTGFIPIALGGRAKVMKRHRAV